MKIHETLNNDYNLEIRYKIIKYFSDEDLKKLLQLKNWRSITGLLEKMYDNFSLQDSANYTYKFMRLRENNWTNFDERLFLNALRAFKRPRKIKINYSSFSAYSILPCTNCPFSNSSLPI